MSTHERDGLLDAIRANPDDDTPRLVYADWLDENAAGEAERARAEFIRVQCELARLDDDDIGRGAGTLRKALGERILGLEKKYKRAWAADLTGKGPLRGRECFFHFRRGFPDKAFGPAERLIAEGAELFRRAPITYLHVQGVTPENLGALLECPWLANVRSLSLNGPYTGDVQPGWDLLADCPHLSKLRYLWINHGRLTRAGGARLAAANPFPALRDFMASDVDLGAGGVAGLFGGRAFGRLAEAYFNKCGIDDDAVEVLARSPALAGLTKLSLPCHPLSAAAVRAITAGGYWPGLRKLVLYKCGLAEAAAEALAGAGPTGLRELDLSMNALGCVALAALARGRILQSLEVLNLSLNPVWDAGVEALVRSEYLGGLRRLHLSGSGIGPDGAKALAGCPSLSGLSWLTLHGCPILAEGAAALAESPHLGGLDRLQVSNVRGRAKTRLKERFGDRVGF